MGLRNITLQRPASVYIYILIWCSLFSTAVETGATVTVHIIAVAGWKVFVVAE